MYVSPVNQSTIQVQVQAQAQAQAISNSPDSLQAYAKSTAKKPNNSMPDKNVGSLLKKAEKFKVFQEIFYAHDSYNQMLLLAGAIKKKDLNKIEQLLSIGADPDATDSDGKTMLELAVATGSYKAVKFLGHKDANFFATNSDGCIILTLSNELIANSSGREKSEHEETRKHVIEQMALKLLKKSDLGSNTPQEIFNKDHPHTVNAIIEEYCTNNGVNKTPLTIACSTPQVRDDVIRNLIAASSGVDLNAIDGHDFTALQQAIKQGNIVAARLLIEAGADSTILGYNNTTALSIVVTITANNLILYNISQKDLLDLINRLAVLGDLNQVDAEGNSLLVQAIYGGNLATIKHLLSFDNIVIDSKAISLAAKYSQEEKTSSRAGPYVAIKSEIFKVRKQRVIAEEKTSIRNQTALMIASKHTYNYDIAEYLIKNEYDINAKDDYGDTPLNIALMNKNVAVAILLINERADVTTCNWEDKTALSAAVKIKEDDSLISKADFTHLLYMLIFYGKKADINQVDIYGNSLLVQAIYGGNLATIKYLLSFDNLVIDPNAISLAAKYSREKKTSSRAGPYVAIKSEIFKVRKQRIIAEEKTSIRNQTALMIASKHIYNYDIAEYLIKNEYDINAKDDYGDTPLNIALMHGNIGLALFLIGEGVDVTIRNVEKKTAFSVAVKIKADHSLFKKISQDDFINLIDMLKFQGEMADSNYINQVNAKGNSLLAQAIYGGNLATIKHLLSFDNLVIDHNARLVAAKYSQEEKTSSRAGPYVAINYEILKATRKKQNQLQK